MSELAGKGLIFIFGSISKRLRVKPEGGGMQIAQSDVYRGPQRAPKRCPMFEIPTLRLSEDSSPLGWPTGRQGGIAVTILIMSKGGASPIPRRLEVQARNSGKCQTLEQTHDPVN